MAWLNSDSFPHPFIVKCKPLNDGLGLCEITEIWVRELQLLLFRGMNLMDWKLNLLCLLGRGGGGIISNLDGSHLTLKKHVLHECTPIATTGGYCLQPGECRCRIGFVGDTCSTPVSGKKSLLPYIVTCNCHQTLCKLPHKPHSQASPTFCLL